MRFGFATPFAPLWHSGGATKSAVHIDACKVHSDTCRRCSSVLYWWHTAENSSAHSERGATMGTVFTATSKSADAPDIEGGFYDAKFEGVTTKFIEGGQFGDGERFVWNFTLLDDDGEVLYSDGDPITLDALTSMSLNTQSKTTPKSVRFLKALLSAADFAAFEGGQGIDMDSIVGSVAQVDVAIRDNGWPTIVNVLPRRVSRRASRA